jgi:hypothetical protein
VIQIHRHAADRIDSGAIPRCRVVLLQFQAGLLLLLTDGESNSYTGGPSMRADDAAGWLLHRPPT